MNKNAPLNTETRFEGVITGLFFKSGFKTL